MNKFSNFSFNLFLVLFGFFCGNLLPGGSFQFPEKFFAPGEWVSSAHPPNENIPKIHLSNEIIAPQQQIWSAKTLFFAIPGPGLQGLIVLFLAEFINWSGTRMSSQLKRPDSIGKTFQFEVFAKNFFRFQPSKFSYLNSFKIGFLLGIFVDAFKVGS
jgi:hypothetical protein